jgi:predicted transcriptional regulator
MGSGLKISKIRIGSAGVGVLSPLEDDVLRVLWNSKDGGRVRDIHSSLRQKGIALTSVAVILDRLHKKKIVARKISYGRGGSYYIYSPLMTREDFEGSVVDSAVNKLIDAFGPVAVNYFDKRFSRKSK